MKESNFKLILSIVLFTIAFSCKKEEPDTRLVLPAILENNIPLPIPDATYNVSGCGSGVGPGSAENTIEITADGIIADPSKLSIEVDLSHAYGGDVVLELFTPSGESCGLIKRIGALENTSCGTKADFIAGNKLVFNSSFVNLLTDPFASGNYAPTGSLTSDFPTNVNMIPLSTFLLGKNIKGTWKMKMYDFGSTDAGTLNSWKLKFSTGALE